ncbi:mechanosensitive ion channel family protein [Ferrimonas pelagia]|uniref:Small-conductance mechanosensitive channel n=1 Tax=Ferrimonas pelagia TaxID=1177826 RepID=A0ABP9EPS0_9GAMM
MLLACQGWAVELEAVQTDLGQVEQQISQWEGEWDSSQSEFHRQLLQQQIIDAATALGERLDRFVAQGVASHTLEQTDWAVTILFAESQYLQRRLKNASLAIRGAYERYELATTEQELLVWVSFNDMFAYLNWLLLQRADNIQSLGQLNVDTDKEQRSFAQELDQYARYLSLAIRSSAHQQEILNREMKRLPAEQRTELKARLEGHARLVRTGVDSLRDLVKIMASMGLDPTPFNELIFKTTGDLVEAVSSWGAAKTVLKGLLEEMQLWAQDNLNGILSRLMVFALILGAAVLFARFCRHLVEKAVHHERSKLSSLVQDFLVGITGRLVFVIGLLWALAQVGLDLTPLLTGLGVAGIVIGFALQDTLSNFASGVMILIYRPFDVGDYVEAAGVAGKVGKMSLVNTTIRTFDNQVFVVPNAKIWTDTIKNITAERVRRVDMEFGIAYEDDLEHAEQVLTGIVAAHPLILATPETTIKLHRLGDSSVDFIVRPWVKTEDYWEVYWDITRTVKLRFDAEGLSIPYPQRQLHLTDNSE